MGVRREFVDLSDMGASDRKGVKRSYCVPQGGLKFLESFHRGTRLPIPKRPPRVKVEPPLPLEDMPWSFEVHVVSERLRAWFEREAPDHAQYIECSFYGPKKLIPKTPYYLVNWLHLVDCIDMKKSEYEVLPPSKRGGEPEYDFDHFVVDPKKVPKDVLIFRPKLYETVVAIDTRLADKLKASEFTGPQFYPLSIPLSELGNLP